MTDQRRYEGKTVLVFGAGSNGKGWSNGKAAAVQYAREGARVFAVDMHEAAAAETQSIIEGEGNICEVYAANAARDIDVKKAVADCLKVFGTIDALHNNVGIYEMGGVVETSLESWNRVIDVNMKSVFLACKHVIPVMQKQGKGAIVNISSVAGVRWSGASYIGYSASKSGVNQMSRVIALQHGREGIRCNCIMPGLIDTPQTYKNLTGHYGGGDAQKMVEVRRRQVPMQRNGSAWDIARTAAFLNSEEARYITGVVLPVDGGMSCTAVSPTPGD